MPGIPTGFQQWPRILKDQERIKSLFGVTDRDWQDWRWHLKKRVTTVADLRKYLPLSPQEVEEIGQTGLSYRWAVSPYYLSLIDPDDPADPIRRQAIPSLLSVPITPGQRSHGRRNIPRRPGPLTRATRMPDRQRDNQCASTAALAEAG